MIWFHNFTELCECILLHYVLHVKLILFITAQMISSRCISGMSPVAYTHTQSEKWFRTRCTASRKAGHSSLSWRSAILETKWFLFRVTLSDCLEIITVIVFVFPLDATLGLRISVKCVLVMPLVASSLFLVFSLRISWISLYMMRFSCRLPFSH